MNQNRERLILFTRYPEPGKVKTRLIPALGAEGAAALHRRLTLRALRTAEATCISRNADLEIRFDGGSETAMCHWLGDEKLFRPQGEGDLGARMSRAFDESFREDSHATIIIGADCPELTPNLLASAFENLRSHHVVFGPATDGGYYLVGMIRPVPEIFHGPTWGSETVLADSLKIVEPLKLKLALLDRLDDVDRPEDLQTWRRIADAEESGLNRISVIIPALNEAEQINAAVASAKQCSPHEIIVADGGSMDGTPELARNAGAEIVNSQPGRARQMNAGATRATGNVLLFLHADTRLPANYASVAIETLQHPQVAAGAFRFRIGADFFGRSIVERATSWRSRRLQMPYGDQANFLRRSLFEEMGGFADLPIMEDYEFVRRLRQHGRIVTVQAEVQTSGRRWLELGMFHTTLKNRIVILGYRLGVSPSSLAKFYGRNGSAIRPNNFNATKER
jgi:rSAM/selenodomain-associated transferase 2/rSAM/selenodomain-associated transferase 1